MHGESSEQVHKSDDEKLQRGDQPCPSASVPPGISSFVKGGRQISVGDCALFQAGKTLPYVGIIRKVRTDKEGVTQLDVNWLYRPADVKLVKGVSFETAPNEIFYSFHKDSIPAVSLLHPCKVAFLRKGVELPPGLSSFVCRRLYDIANKRLWWLTDRDYTDDHQEEVDQLLDRTKLEMQAAVQSGVASPRALAGNPSQQPKSNSDNAPNSTLSNSKTKKRERTDQTSELSKRERSTRAEDLESLHIKRERTMKADDISAIVDKDGGIFSLAGVDKLITLMQEDKNDSHRKVSESISRRIMLAGIIAATEKEDCLNRFVQLGGLPMLDDWLQEAHKGKSGDGESPKEGEKNSEDLLLILLRALDKLPVDLDALKTCIVGKSVNNLRSHKNSEIQKKARRLVEIWKKRVDAEMKLSGEIRPGPQTIAWSSRQQGMDSLTSHSVKTVGPQEAVMKTAKTSSNGFISSAEAVTKAIIGASVAGKISNMLSHNSPLTKDVQHVKQSSCNVPADVLSTSVKEEKSSCSSQSQNYVPSWSSAQIKGMMNAGWREDVRNSSVTLPNVKVSGSVLKSNGKALLGQNGSGNQKENLGGKSLVWSRNAVNGVISEKGVADMVGHSEAPSNQRLIVRLPNPGRSPARTVSAGSIADCPIPSRGSSPNTPERRSASTPAEVMDEKCRPSFNVQTDMSAEAVSNLRNTTSGKGRFTDGEAKQSDVVLEDNIENVKANLEHLRDTSRNCSSGEECRLQNENQFAGGTSCVSTLSAQKSSTDGSTEADSSWKGDNATIVTHTTEDISPAADASIAPVNEGGIREDMLCSETDSAAGTGPRNAYQERHITASMVQADTAVKNYVHGDQEFREDAVNDGRQGFHPSDAGVASLASLAAKLEELGQHGPKTLLDDSSAFTTKFPSVAADIDGECDFQIKKNLSRPSSSLEGDDIKVNAANVQGPSKESPSQTFVDSIGKGLNLTEVTLDCASERKGNTGDASQARQGGTDEKSTSLQGNLERNSRDGGNIRSERDNLAQEVVEELAQRDKEYVAVCPGEDKVEVTRHVGKEAHQEVEGHIHLPPDGALVDEETQDGRSVLHEVTDKRCDTLDSGRSNVFDQSREKLNEEISVPASEKQVADGADSNRKGEEVNSGMLLRLIPSDEAKVSNTTSSNSLAEDRQAADAREGTQKPLVSQTVGSLPQIMAIGGSVPDGAFANDDLKMKTARCGDATGKPFFDLNEGFEDTTQDNSSAVVAPSFSAAISSSVSVPSATSNGLAAPIAVVASTNTTFIPPASPLRVNKELGWKGSAATSAFRPAEPRQTPERQQASVESLSTGSHHVSGGKQVRHALDIDLNIADDRLMEDVGLANFASQVSSVKLEVGGHVASHDALISGLEGQNLSCVTTRPVLDLNRVDDSVDGGTELNTSENRSGSGPSSISRNIVRDFDLNDGPMPSFEELSNEEATPRYLPARTSGLHVIPSVAAPRMSGELSKVTPWITPGSTFSAVAIPAFPGTRGDPTYPVASAAAAQSFLNAGMCVTPYNSEMFRAGPAVLSSSSALVFPTNPPCPYPYPAFPFGASFPLGSAPFTSSSASFGDATSVSSLSPISSQMVTSGSVALPFMKPPFLMSVSDGAGGDTNGPWGRLNLDLNAGPEAADTDTASIRHPVLLSNSHLSVEDQMRALRQAGAASGTSLKRKEPEGGLEAFRGGAKHIWR